MAKDRSMAIKHAKAKKEAMKQALSDANDFAQTSWGRARIAEHINSVNIYAQYSAFLIERKAKIMV